VGGVSSPMHPRAPNGVVQEQIEAGGGSAGPKNREVDSTASLPRWPMGIKSGVSGGGPTYRPPPLHSLAPVLDRNIEALRQRRASEQEAASWQESAADSITSFTGSMTFVFYT